MYIPITHFNWEGFKYYPFVATVYQSYFRRYRSLNRERIRMDAVDSSVLKLSNSAAGFYIDYVINHLTFAVLSFSFIIIFGRSGSSRCITGTAIYQRRTHFILGIVALLMSLSSSSLSPPLGIRRTISKQHNQQQRRKLSKCKATS